jgi:DNA-binding GntR family transcriptional regulator
LVHTHNSANDNNLALKVYKSVRKMMLDYEIVPGQRLIFSDLAKRFNVSRTPVNTALAMLAKEGLLDFVPHQGYTVHRLTRTEAECLYEILGIITEGTIARSIRRLTPEHLAVLEQRMLGCEKALDEQATREQFLLDQEFHAYTIEIAQIRGLADYFRSIYEQLYLRITLKGLRHDRAQAVVREHRLMLEAIRQKDIDEASALLDQHFKAGRRYVFDQLFNEEVTGQTNQFAN